VVRNQRVGAQPPAQLGQQRARRMRHDHPLDEPGVAVGLRRARHARYPRSKQRRAIGPLLLLEEVACEPRRGRRPIRLGVQLDDDAAAVFVAPASIVRRRLQRRHGRAGAASCDQQQVVGRHRRGHVLHDHDVKAASTEALCSAFLDDPADLPHKVVEKRTACASSIGYVCH
jgi:hypothetical protein